MRDRPQDSAGTLSAIRERLPDTALLEPKGPSSGQCLFTFAFEGVVGRDCFVCEAGSGAFGRGVPPGTPLRGRFTFDPDTRPTASFEPNRVDYFGVSVRLTVGAESVSGNTPSRAKIQIHNGPPSGDSYSLIVEGGFSSGSIAGVRIDKFSWVVSGTASLFSDTSLPPVPFSLDRGQILEGQISRVSLAP